MATTSSKGGSRAKMDPHGMDKAIWQNIAKKFDDTRAILVINWVGEVTGEEMPAQGSEPVVEWFANTLKDGYYLTALMLKLEPGVRKQIKGAKNWKAKHTNAAFTAMNSIQIFGEACKWVGVPETDVVTSQDVFQKENPNAVLCCLYSLCARAVKRGWNGPVIADGFSHANANKRHFSAEVIAKGKNAIPMMNKGSLAVDKGNRLDGAGIVKTAGSEDHKADYSALSTWQKGGVHVESAPRVDHIIRTKANDDWKISNEIPELSKGAIQHEDNSRIDGYGIVLQPKHHKAEN